MDNYVVLFDKIGYVSAIKINETTFDGVKCSQFILYCAQLALSL
jgi:hypothetical protein